MNGAERAESTPIGRWSWRSWWAGGWHEARAFALAVGILSAYEGFATLYAPASLLLQYGFSGHFFSLVVSPSIFAAVLIYFGLTLSLSRSGRFRYALLTLTTLAWTYIAWDLASSRNDYTLLASPLATITIALVALVRARAWLGRSS